MNFSHPTKQGDGACTCRDIWGGKWDGGKGTHVIDPNCPKHGYKTNLRADAGRLAEIAERVLAGEPIEDFHLGEYEIHVVIGYCQRAQGLV